MSESDTAEADEVKKEESDDEMDDSSSVVDDPCPVCLSSRKNESSIDGCKHTFCYSCICEWIKNAEKCPLCKAPVTEVYSTVNGKRTVKRLIDLKAEAEAARIMVQAGETPMTTERDAVTHHIHLQRAVVQKIVDCRQKSRLNSATINDSYRRETSKLTQLTALRDEMERIPRREIIGDARFRALVYEGQLVWKAISRPSTTLRFTPQMACAEADRIKERVTPFIRRELKFVMIDKKMLSERVVKQVLIDMQNYEINNPSFELVLMNTRLYVPDYLGIFSLLLYEFCASGLEMDAFDANSSYSLDPNRAPSGRFIPSLLPSTSRFSDPIFVEGHEGEEDEDERRGRQPSESSSNDSVQALYNHPACRLPSPTRGMGNWPIPPSFSAFPPLHQHLMAAMGYNVNQMPFPPPFTSSVPPRVAATRSTRTRPNTNPEVISLDDDPSTSDVARVNTLPLSSVDSLMEPSWLNVTGGPSTSSSSSSALLNGMGRSLPPLAAYSSQMRRDADRANRDRESSRDRVRRERSEKEIRDRVMRRLDERENGKRSHASVEARDEEERRRESKSARSEQKRRKQEEEKRKKDVEFMGEKIGSRRNSLMYYHDKVKGANLSLRGLERVSGDIDQFVSRLSELKESCKRQMRRLREAEDGSSGSSQNAQKEEVVDLEKEESMEEERSEREKSDEASSSPSSHSQRAADHDDTIVIP